MNLIINHESNKRKCQKFTSQKEVKKMLDLADYRENLFGKKILEYSFGNGNIIKEVVKRYIDDAFKKKITKEEISKGLSADIYGIEIDSELYQKCVEDLNCLIGKNGIPSVNWSLFCLDTLKWETEIRFDFVIGNPPYISYRNIDSKNRDYIKRHFSCCRKGKFDYCYAFLEKGIKLLSESGKIVQLVPSNIYKNVFANELRKMLVGGIEIILEYPDQSLFKDTITTSSIFLFKNHSTKTAVKYLNVTQNKYFIISKEFLGDKWEFKEQGKENSSVKMIRFGDRYNASSSVATLLNEAFVIEQSGNIESACLRKGATPRLLRNQKQTYIIFPYYFDEAGDLQHYIENDFKNRFPNTYAHLLNYNTRLLKRNSDGSAAWYEYGRSQALRKINKEKLIISTVITNRVEIYNLDKDTVPYSGIYITANNDEYPLNKAKEILEDKSFFEYIISRGLSVNGKSIRITCKDINDYYFKEE